MPIPEADRATDAPERLILAFSTAAVAIVGARRGKLVELIGEHSLASVSALDARYAGAVGCGPWVAVITIARLDEAGTFRASGSTPNHKARPYLTGSPAGVIKSRNFLG